MSVVDISQPSHLIDDHLGRLSPEFEEVNLLSVKFEDRVIGIGQADERQIPFTPVILELTGPFGTHGDYHRIPSFELRIIPAQLRQMPPAKRSGEAPVQHEYHAPIAAKLRKANGITSKILQGKIGRTPVKFYLGHVKVSFPGFSADSSQKLSEAPFETKIIFLFALLRASGPSSPSPVSGHGLAKFEQGINRL